MKHQEENLRGKNLSKTTNNSNAKTNVKIKIS